MIVRPKDARLLLGLGLVFFVSSLLLHLFVHPAAAEWRDGLDWTTGFFLGVSLPVIWLAWRMRRRWSN